MPLQGIGRAGGGIARNAITMLGASVGSAGLARSGARWRARPLLRSSLLLPPFGRWQVQGVTRDSTGAALGLCQVEVYTTGGRLLGGIQSDGSGNFTIPVDTNGPCFVVAYLAGAPDRAGVTVYGIQPVPA